MKTARAQLPELVDRTRFGGVRFRLTRYTKDVAALVGVEDLEFLERVDAALDRAEVLKALESNEPVYDFDAFRSELAGGPKAKLRTSRAPKSR